MELEILQPTGLERRAAYMLLPEIKPNSFWNYFLLAKDPKSKRILGAAASCPGRNEQGLPRLHTRLHVPPPYRRQGVGRKLI
jgi:GNAT superfamily N-acetyltransferase